ncbi:NADPH-dependent ferric siderophore reductase, contains FAD-binding and SIP domains [Arthrobacter alpinus]|uniref:NADPH-dependent ferric siderophore reductase, contains FAD-binding and SIP domains n=1 Tax=Arthrobacter alpinus TaxID=656366 RepID=A0A1H5L995_9MICC|nr:NADPH-dependent ferric siderophore reductase, contains FAD-binding and SIP domains [Arthrobacter alpinus]
MTPADTVPAEAPIRAPRPQRPRVQLTLQVLRKEQLSSHMVRIIVGGPDMAKFEAKDATDMYVKIHFLNPGVDYAEPVDIFAIRDTMPAEHWSVTRTYTLRWVDVAAQEIAIDFVLHGDSGLAGPWAAAAQPGDRIIVTNPGGAYKPNPDADWHLFAGDEAALPAIAASLEALPSDARGQAYIEVEDAADIQPLVKPDGVELSWVFRNGATPDKSTVLLDAVANGVWLDGTVHAFVHGEREYMKALRDLLIKQRGLDRSQVSLSGYWAYGRTEDNFQAEKKEPIGKIL